MKKGLKSSDGGDGGKAKLLSKKDKKSSKQQISDTGVIDSKTKEDKDHNDSFEKYYNKDLDLDEDQVPVVIYELNESAINFISQESFEKALILLQKAQTMLEQICAAKNQHDKFVFLLTMHNMALCYQKLGVLDECANCLEQCLGYLTSEYIQDYFNDPNNPSLKLKMLKYKCKTHMQVCALLSQVHKHKEAALHANQAIQIAHFLVHDTESLCSYFTKELIQKKPLEEVSLISNFSFSLLEKTAVKLLPIFQAVLKKIAIEDDQTETQNGVPCSGPLPEKHHSLQRTHTSQPNAMFSPVNIVKTAQIKANSRLGSGLNLQVGDADMKNILGYLNQNEWIYSLNIGNIMQIAPLTLQDFLSSTAIQIELSREFVLEKMCFLAVSYFCMGTEFRFLHQLNETIGGVKFQRKDSEYWHGKAVELAISFLPSESPLVSHILMSYEKHHSPSNMAIPEEDSQDVKVRVVRQIHGIDSNRLQPIIRFHPDSDYRVQFIQMTPLDYFSIFGKNGQSMTTTTQLRRRNIDTKKAQSLNSQAAKSQPKRPSSKTPSQPLSSKTGHSKNIAFSSANMPLTTTGAGISSSGVPDTISSGDGVSDIHKTTDNVMLEDINIVNGADESIVVEERERNLHSKKHRRQLLSPPSAAAGLAGVSASIAKNGGNFTNTNGVTNSDKEFMKLEDQKALTQKKAKRLLQNGQNQAKTVEFKTLSQHLKGRKSDGLNDMEDEESQEEDIRGHKGAKARPQTQMFGDIDIPNKERQRSSELGISNKYHRRLQTSVIGKHLQVDNNGIDQIRIEEDSHMNQDGSQNQFAQERRARSSLSNRNHSGHGKRSSANKGPAVSGAVANTSQVMNGSGFDVGQANMLGLNSSQPIIFNKGQHNLDLNTNLRQVNKNRSQLVDQLTNQSNQQMVAGTFDMQQHVSGSTKNVQQINAKNNGDRVQSRSQNKRSSSQNQNGPVSNLPAQHNSITSMQATNSGVNNNGQPVSLQAQKQSSSSRRFKGNQQASGNEEEMNRNRLQAIGQNQHLEMISSSAPMSQVQSTMAAGPGLADKQSLKSGQRQSMQLMNQKGAAPITDIRAKRQAATLNVEDLPGNTTNGGNISSGNAVIQANGNTVSIGSAGNGAHPNQLANQHMAQMQRNNKKFVELASKANSNMLAAQQVHQQMIMNQFTKNQSISKGLNDDRRIDTFEQIGSLTSTSQTTANRSSSQQMTHTGSRSSKNALAVQNLASLNTSQQNVGGTGKHNSSSSKRKASKKLGQNAQALYNSQQPGGQMISNGLTHEQLLNLMQNKREKFNQSAIVGGVSRQMDDIAAAQSMMIQQQRESQPGQRLHNQKRTPTSFTGASHENIPHTLQVSSFVPVVSKHQKSKEKGLKMTHQQNLMQMTDVPTNMAKAGGIQMGHQMQFASNPSGPNTSKGPGHLHQRTSSQIATHSNQMMFTDQSAASHATVNQINRKSSMEAKVGGQAAVGGVIKSGVDMGITGAGEQPIRSKAQYDNWLQLQVMKKATGAGAANQRSQSSNNSSGKPAGQGGAGAARH